MLDSCGRAGLAMNAFRSLYDRLRPAFSLRILHDKFVDHGRGGYQEVFIALLNHGKRYKASEGDLGASHSE